MCGQIKVKPNVYQLAIGIFIASVWLINGLLCKILGLTPRHEEIVARILGSEFAHPLTLIIGGAEIFMGLWILSNYRKKLTTYTQIILVTIMNILEFILAPDLLLWGYWNILWAMLFCIIVWLNYRMTTHV